MLTAYSLGISSKDRRLQWRSENFMVFLLDAWPFGVPLQFLKLFDLENYTKSNHIIT